MKMMYNINKILRVLNLKKLLFYVDDVRDLHEVFDIRFMKKGRYSKFYHGKQYNYCNYRYIKFSVDEILRCFEFIEGLNRDISFSLIVVFFDEKYEVESIKVYNMRVLFPDLKKLIKSNKKNLFFTFNQLQHKEYKTINLEEVKKNG